MATQAQVEANRRNAQGSTGPRTEEGKARSRANGVRHGLRAEKVLVMDEDPGEYVEYRQGMLESLRPEGELERTLAERVIAQGWRLKRVPRAEAALLNRDLGKCHHIAMNELPPEHRQRWDEEPDSALVGLVLGESMSGPANSYETLRRYERTIERGFYAALHELRAIRKERRTDAEFSREPKASAYRADHQSPTNAAPPPKENAEPPIAPVPDAERNLPGTESAKRQSTSDRRPLTTAALHALEGILPSEPNWRPDGGVEEPETEAIGAGYAPSTGYPNGQ